MKVYRIIVIVFAIIVGISYCIFSISTPSFQAAIKEPVTEEYYKYLKENALKVAKTLDTSVLNDETLTSDFYLEKNELVVTVESFKAKVTAKIPISNNLLDVKDDGFKIQGTYQFENMEVEEKKLLEPLWFYIGLIIVGSILLPCLIYLLLFSAWCPYPKTK